MSRNLVVPACLVLLVVSLPAHAKCRSCGSKSTVIDLSVQTDAPERFKGPHKIIVQKINRLRYGATIGDKLTFEPGPDLGPAKFAFAPSAETAAAAGVMNAEVEAAIDTGDVGIAELREELFSAKMKKKPDLTAIQEALRTCASKIRASFREATEAEQELAGRHESLLSFLNRSDQILALPMGEENLLSQIRVEKGRLDLLPRKPWPLNSIATNRTCLEDIKNDLDRLATDPEFSAWLGTTSNYKLYTNVQKSVDDLAKKLDELDLDSERYKGYLEIQKNDEEWSNILGAFTVREHFQQEVAVNCGHPFFETKKIEYQITLRDRLEEDETKATTVRKIAIVECPTVVTLTGGMSLTNLDDREIEFVSSKEAIKDDPATTDVESGVTFVNKFGFTERGTKQVNPVVLINTRLTDRLAYNLHATAGTVFDLNNADSGVAIGYLLGVSLSLRDVLFLTVGAQAGRVPKLAGGFNIGDEVPADLAAPPLEKEWKVDGVVAVTFKIP